MKLVMKFNPPWVVEFDPANFDAWEIKDKNGQIVMERESYTGDGDHIHLCVAEAVEMVELINRMAGKPCSECECDPSPDAFAPKEATKQLIARLYA